MDTLTHIALGACMGEAFAGKTLGKKAMLWGIMAQSVPDIDFVASFWLPTSANLLAHRGFTHSILFCLLITPLLAMLAERFHRPHNVRLLKWMLFFGTAIVMHIFLDAFNNYGVGWFEPFNHSRVSFNAIYVVDPFFSIWSGIAFIMLLYLKKWNRHRQKWVRFGLVFSMLYLVYCSVNKLKINNDVKYILEKQAINYTKYFTTPAPLQSWLWFVVAGNDTGYYVGFRSLLDSKKEIKFQYFPKNDSLLNIVSDHEDVQQLKRFSKQFYTVEQWNDTLVFNDLRFGQIIGWQNPREKFVFHYFLQHPSNNTLVVQRGRFAKWDWDVVVNFLHRIKGNGQ